MLCTIHCIATPILLTSLSVAGAAFAEHPLIEWGFVVAGAIVGLFSLRRGYLRHRRLMPAMIFLPSICLLLLARLVEGSIPEPLVVATAAVGLTTAHVLNLRFTRCCETVRYSPISRLSEDGAGV